MAWYSMARYGVAWHWHGAVGSRGRSQFASFQPDGVFMMYRTQTCISAGKCYRFMRRVIKNVSKRLVKLMVQVNCMK